jgi:hypothetical protein
LFMPPPRRGLRLCSSSVVAPPLPPCTPAPPRGPREVMTPGPSAAGARRGARGLDDLGRFDADDLGAGELDGGLDLELGAGRGDDLGPHGHVHRRGRDLGRRRCGRRRWGGRRGLGRRGGLGHGLCGRQGRGRQWLGLGGGGGGGGVFSITGVGMTSMGIGGGGGGTGAGFFGITRAAGGSATAVDASGIAPGIPSSLPSSFFPRPLRGLALTFSRSTFSAVSTEVAWAPELNHSRIVASRPAEMTERWFLTLSSGIPSARHLATIALASIPRSFAMALSRRIAKSNSRVASQLRCIPDHEPCPRMSAARASSEAETFGG